MHSQFLWFAVTLLLFVSPLSAATKAPTKADCATMPCKEVLPGAVSFRREGKKPWLTGFDSKNQRVGWVALSSEVVRVPAYSGQPMITLVGLDKKGVITGAKVIFHSEPILLVGIPQSALDSFVRFYVGKKATTKIAVGSGGPGTLSVDVISGATVTALAQNKTILETARAVGVATGVISLSKTAPGHFIKKKKPLTWKEMVDQKVFGRLTVSEKQMGLPNPSGNFVDLWYTIADAPQVGRAILGDGDYEYLKKKLKPGEHLFVILGKGSNSFKGSAFVRGGIFDRVRVEQGIRELLFRDTDYQNLSRVHAKGAPRFKEGAVFITRGAPLDPGSRYELVFLGSRYDGKGAYHRNFRQFKSSHRLPSSVYFVKGGRSSGAMYIQAWKNRRSDVVVLSLFLLFILGLFSARRWMTADMKRLRWLHTGSMLFSFVVLGLYMRAQPSVTQLLTLVDATVRKWRWELFLSEPGLFLLWLFIAAVSLIWGRGVFCGWVCPYGAMSELLFKVGQKLGIPAFELSERIHNPAKYLRYVLLLLLVPLFLFWPGLGEQAAEIEPFKSTFFVYFWKRHWGFLLWWLVLFVSSFFWHRVFCRYLCPLGAGLALFGSFRFSGPRRREFCSSCKICTKGCEPRAIRSDGSIDPRECLSCMECEANYRDEEVCPPLLGLAKIREKGTEETTDKKRFLKLLEQVKDV